MDYLMSRVQERPLRVDFWLTAMSPAQARFAGEAWGNGVEEGGADAAGQGRGGRQRQRQQRRWQQQ